MLLHPLNFSSRVASSGAWTAAAGRTCRGSASSARTVADFVTKVLTKAARIRAGGMFARVRSLGPAMPSMHVAIAVLLALFGWRLNRWAGAALTLFALLIMVGSVHLGWHYAVDGYVSAVVGIGIWYAVGWVQRRAKPSVGALTNLRAIRRRPAAACSAPGT